MPSEVTPHNQQLPPIQVLTIFFNCILLYYPISHTQAVKVLHMLMQLLLL